MIMPAATVSAAPASLVRGPVSRIPFAPEVAEELLRLGLAESVFLSGSLLGWRGRIECLQITKAGLDAWQKQGKP